jgi:hypothetical protein
MPGISALTVLTSSPALRGSWEPQTAALASVMFLSGWDSSAAELIVLYLRHMYF